MKHAGRRRKEHPHEAEFRFYGELNDFLPAEKRRQAVAYRFDGHPGIKDAIEAQGVPHVEVERIVVNGDSAGFEYRLKNGDRAAVYPGVGSPGLAPGVKLREKPRRKDAFVVDVNLGRLARRLRLLGFDVLFSNAYADDEIVRISEAQGRIVLTRDRRLLYAKAVTHGTWVRSVWPRQQVEEVVRRFDLSGHVRPFSRCADCNGRIEPVAKEAVADQLEPKTKKYYEMFYRCSACGKIYWEGSHVGKLRERFRGVM